MAGGVVEVSSATLWGKYNSRPSTRFGERLVRFNEGLPIDRDGTVFKVTCPICPKADAAPNKTSVRAEICLGFIGFPGARTRGALLLRIPNAPQRANVQGYWLWAIGRPGRAGRVGLLHCELSQKIPVRPRVCAVSFLNTTPLVWGMLHGPQQGLFDLDFRIPAACADQLASGAADIGIVPSYELTRQDLQVIPGAGIACHGAVRSILLVSSRPAAEIQTVAVDTSSRTSVQLARVILERRYGARPVLIPHPP